MSQPQKFILKYKKFSVNMTLSPFCKLEMSIMFVCMYGIFIFGDKTFKKIQYKK